MDGRHLRAQRVSLTGRRRHPPKWPGGVALGIIVLTLYGSQAGRALTADRPLNVRPASRQLNDDSSTLPPSPTRTQKEEAKEAKAKSKKGNPPANLTAYPLNNVTENTDRLRRFPSKSIEGRVSARNPAGDIPLDLDLDEAVSPIDLPAALQLGGWNSPEVLVAQQRVLAATALQQLAAAQALPDFNIGLNDDAHTGATQQSTGAIIQSQRNGFYLGAGANAVVSGTVNIPGLSYDLNVGQAYFAYLTSRQLTERSAAGAAAIQNNVLLQVAGAYCQLVRAQGIRAIAVQIRDEAAEIARMTATFAAAGEGRPADAERAKTELEQREADIYAADAAIIETSARLAQILNLESSIRLQSSENWSIPRSVVPDPIPLPELIAISLYQRPEVAERRADVHAAMLQLDNAKLLLFSPQFIANFSDGVFGGGSAQNTAISGAPRFGDFDNRNDANLMLYWSIRNLGVGNRALIKIATARLAAADWDRTWRFNQIRAEVADAYARTQTASAQLPIRYQAVLSSERGLREDMRRARADAARPIEVLDSLRLQARAKQDYLNTITNYNQAQYELYVAIGQPPADLLIHRDPPTVPPTPVAEPQQ